MSEREARPPTAATGQRPEEDPDLVDVPVWVNSGGDAAGDAAGDLVAAQPSSSGRVRQGSRSVRRTPRRGRRLLLVFAIAVASFVLIAGVALFWVLGRIHGTPGAAVDVVIPPGATRAATADLLTRDGVVSDSWLFRWYLRYDGIGLPAAGDYVFRAHEGYAAAVADLRRGPKIVVTKLTIPEGFTLAQIAARVGRLSGHTAAQFLAVAQSGAVRSRYEPPASNNLEGMTFPDTYFVQPGESDALILQAMVQEFDQLGSSLGLDVTLSGRLANGLTPYETIVVASMVEREAKVAGDRGKIARVIDNRLQRGMRLQIDATVLYALGYQKTGLTNRDLTVNSPYNTYRVAGLPPAPIANPGRDSLQAALNPTPGPWLYYVLAGADGHHAFATTSREFEILKAQAQAMGLL